MRRLICAAVLLALASTVVAAPAGAAKRKTPVRAKRAQLKAFASCPDLVAYGRRYAVSPNVADGVPPRAVEQVPVPLGATQRTAANTETIAPTAAPAPASAGDTAADSFSGTNNQEPAVDESDIVKTDGKRAYVVYGDQAARDRRHGGRAEAARLAEARGQRPGAPAARDRGCSRSATRRRSQPRRSRCR